MGTKIGCCVVLVLAGAPCGGALGDDGLATSDRGPAASAEPAQRLAASPELMDRGRELYRRRCAACHGEEGRGNGEAAYLLYPKSRNFARGQFRLVSTWDGAPTDDDLFRVISRGIPGSAMPSWAHLSATDRWALIHFTKSLAGETGTTEGDDNLIDVPPEPPEDSASVELGRALFAEHCAKCHGPGGRGDGPTGYWPAVRRRAILDGRIPPNR